MTAKLEHTTRSMLIDIHARIPQIEWSVENLREQNRMLALEREALLGTNRIAALTVDRLTRENDELRRTIGLMLYERMRCGNMFVARGK